jgi:glycosyltransferase involved in cell wall biosynthesis
MRILLISHQLDYSGAPIALLRLAHSLCELGDDVTMASLRGGPLANDFASLPIASYDPRADTDFDLYVANTVVTVPVALTLSGRADRVLAWIHETGDFFEVARIPPREYRLHELRYAAFPSRFQIDEFAEWLPDARTFQLRNCVSMPEFDPAGADPDYYVCSGKWEPRKNQFRLFELLNSLQREPRLVFIGADRPVQLQASRHDFTGAVSPARSKQLTAQSRGLISTSLLEAQPLAVIEALLARRPVLLSDIPAHRELKEAMPDVILFALNSVKSFVRGFHELEAQWSDAALRDRLREGALQCFGSVAFTANVDRLLGIIGAPLTLR